MIRCTRCVMPNTRPDTPFVDGVCQACINYARRPEIDWDARKQELLDLLDRHDGRCIVPSSGGKDSHFQVMTLLELGADVTAVTASTCHLTKIGRMNLDNLARHVRTIEVTPNKSVRAKLNKIGFELVGDPSWPEHIGIHRVPFRVAHQIGVPLIFFGECPNNAYGGPDGTEHTREMTLRWTAEFGGFLGLRTKDVIGMNGITERDMRDYEAPTQEELDAAGVKAYFLGQFIGPWNSHENAAVAKDAGMIQVLPCAANWWNAENLDNLDTWQHDHLCYRKYGYGRLCMQLSIDIRHGLWDRETALELVKMRDGLIPEIYAATDIEDGLNRIGITREQMFKMMDAFTNWSLFDRVEDGRPILKEFV